MKRPLVFIGILFLLVSLIRILLTEKTEEQSFSASQQELFRAADTDGRAAVSGTVEECTTVSDGIRYTLSGLSVKKEDGTYCRLRESDHKIIFTLKKDIKEEKNGTEETLLPGCRIIAAGKLRAFEPARNPGQFDIKKYYQRQDTVCQMTDTELLEIKPGDPNLRAFLYLIRSSLAASFRNILGEKDAKTIAAITLGEKSGMDAEVKELYQESGIAHATAVSGLHAQVLGMMVYRLLRGMLLGIPASAVCSGGILYLYVILAGEGVSAWRALLMFGIWLLAQILGKKYDVKTAAWASVMLILMSQPYELLDSSFLLSFGAVLTIAFFLPCMRQVFGTDHEGKRKKRREALIFGIGIWIGMLPVTLYSFYKTPIYSILLNLVVVPLTPVLMILGLSGSVIGLISESAGIFFAAPVHYLLSFIEFLCRLELYIPQSLQICGRPSIVSIVLYYLILTVLCLGTERRISLTTKMERAGERKKKSSRRIKVLWMIGISFGLLLMRQEDPQKLEIACMDVGQGDGALIRIPDGTVCLIDGGSSTVNELWKYRISAALQFYGCNSVDYWFLSHADQDHISAVMEMMRSYETNAAGKNIHGITINKLILPSGTPEEDFREIRSAAKKNRIPVYRMSQGSEIRSIRENDWKIRCLSPDTEHLSGDRNQDSMVLLFQYRQFRMLFTGDLEGETEKRLVLEQPEQIAADLLKVGHHGSANASSEPFLNIVSPSAAVISCAAENRYGHPAPDTVKRLKNSGAVLFNTAECGALLIHSDGSGYTIEPFLK